MNLEYLFYLPFGNNIIIGPHIKSQLNFLSRVVPEEFKEKEMHDLGCGDGKVTTLLKEIFKAKKCFGYDIHPFLVKLARKRKVKAKVLDLEKEVPRGQLAVIWGVLHHLKNPRKILRAIRNNFKFVFIREPLKKGISILELGKPFKEKEIRSNLNEIFGDHKEYIYKNAIFVFWRKRNK